MHLPKASSVPKFGREVAPFLDLLFIEADVLAAWRNAHETKAQTVRAILVDQLERVGILCPVFRISGRFNADINFGFWILNFGFFLPIPRRYPVPPPDLAANAPVANVLQPLRVNSFPMCREEANKMVAHHGQSFLRFRVAKEPLFADPRLDRHVASLAESDIVFVCLRFRK